MPRRRRRRRKTDRASKTTPNLDEVIREEEELFDEIAAVRSNVKTMRFQWGGQSLLVDLLLAVHNTIVSKMKVGKFVICIQRKLLITLCNNKI